MLVVYPPKRFLIHFNCIIFFMQTLRRKEFFGQYGKIVKVVVVPPAEAFLNSRVV